MASNGSSSAGVVYVGIGFGTLNSTVAIVGKDGNGETIANEDGDRNIPSYVAFTGYEEIIGSQAKVQAMSNPKGTIVQFRSLLGLKFEDEEVQNHVKHLPMSIVRSDADPSLPNYEVDVYESESEDAEPIQQKVSVSSVTEKYLRKLKETAESFLGKAVTGTVISIPSHFAEKSKKALLDAAQQAGFSKTYAIVEPVAAALAFDRSPTAIAGKSDRLVLVVDLGGHQFNVTLLSANNGLYSVVSSLDDYKLGGVHFDEVLVQYVREEFKKKHKVDISANRRSMAKVRSACEQTKRMLSQKDTAPCSVDSVYDGIDFHGQLIRGRFENLAEGLFTRCADLVRRVLKESAIRSDEIDEVMFVGGASRIPRFQAVIRSLFPESVRIRTDVEPDEAIGNGAAIQAGIIAELEATGVKYSEALALKELTELSHLHQSIGIATASGAFVPIIPKLTPIPARRSFEFSNAVDGQTEVYLAVYEGEEKVAKKNQLLAEVVLQELPQGQKAGSMKIDVVFLIEKDEVLSVEARERVSGAHIKVRVTPHK
ncbi:heat shock protein 70 family [Zopfochytrium polystomum]|nr:heat shock protein 70 family [Zopfochytrium polystomum]